MKELGDALGEVGADHSPLGTVLVRLTDLQRRRSRRTARTSAMGAGLGVAVLAGSIFALGPIGAAPGQGGPGIIGAPVPGTSAARSPEAGADPADVKDAAQQERELQERRAATAAAAAAERNRAQAAQAQAQAREQGEDPAEIGAAHRAAVARSLCQFLLTSNPPLLFTGDEVDPDGAVRLARSCLDVGADARLDVSWVVTTMDRFGDALFYQQPRLPGSVVVLQVQGTDGQGDTRDWLIVLLPAGGRTIVDGRYLDDLSINLYPAVTDTPREFDLGLLGTVHRP